VRVRVHAQLRRAERQQARGHLERWGKGVGGGAGVHLSACRTHAPPRSHSPTQIDRPSLPPPHSAL
jgi:hypothetical protein